MPRLRYFQQRVKDQIYEAWRAGKRYVMPVLPTGAGKTVLFSNIAAEWQNGVAAIAHRGELVSQMSLALARYGVRHRVIGSRALQKSCAALHSAELGRPFVDAGARVAAVSVDTIIKRDMSQDSWARQVGLLIEDEAHHVLQDNKWGKALEMFPNAYGMLPTATPRRADGQGLGHHADGYVDALIVGPTMRDLINEGYLTDYRVTLSKDDVDYEHLPIGASGEVSMPKLREAVHRSKSRIGGIVDTYLRTSAGKLGITFAVDVEDAGDIAQQFKAKGVAAEVVTAQTPDLLRFELLRKFKAGIIQQLVNVDLFGEGFDLPAVHCVSFGRRTESFALYAQQFGRPVRLELDAAHLSRLDDYTPEQRRALIAASGKPFAQINDHVGNIMRHRGPPDMPQVWSLDRREGRGGNGASDAIPVTRCLGPLCGMDYERWRRACPYCGKVRELAERATPAQVDGVMIDLDAEALAALRGEMRRVDMEMPHLPAGLSAGINGEIIRKHLERRQAIEKMRGAMNLWAGWKNSLGHSDPEAYSLFYYKFKVDAATAQTLGAREAGELHTRIIDHLKEQGVIV